MHTESLTLQGISTLLFHNKVINSSDHAHWNLSVCSFWEGIGGIEGACCKGVVRGASVFLGPTGIIIFVVDTIELSREGVVNLLVQHSASLVGG